MSTITRELAEQFVAGQPAELWNCTSITEDAAKVLSKYDGPLELNGLESLSAAAASALQDHKGRLELNSLATIEDDVADALSRHDGSLFLNSLTQLSNSVADSFSQMRGILSLEGLNGDIAKETIDLLSRFSGKLYTNGTIVFDDKAGVKDLGTSFLSVWEDRCHTCSNAMLAKAKLPVTIEAIDGSAMAWSQETVKVAVPEPSENADIRKLSNKVTEHFVSSIEDWNSDEETYMFRLRYACPSCGQKFTVKLDNHDVTKPPKVAGVLYHDPTHYTELPTSFEEFLERIVKNGGRVDAGVYRIAVLVVKSSVSFKHRNSQKIKLDGLDMYKIDDALNTDNFEFGKETTVYFYDMTPVGS